MISKCVSKTSINAWWFFQSICTSSAQGLNFFKDSFKNFTREYLLYFPNKVFLHKFFNRCFKMSSRISQDNSKSSSRCISILPRSLHQTMPNILLSMSKYSSRCDFNVASTILLKMLQSVTKETQNRLSKSLSLSFGNAHKSNPISEATRLSTKKVSYRSEVS